MNEVVNVQPGYVERLRWLVEAGALLWNPARQCYETTLHESAETFLARPNIVGITRELELERSGSWMGTLFDYRPPRFGFSRAEQHLLQVALSGPGGTDPELAGAFHVSLPTIKKMWGSIYQRVAGCDPELVPDPVHAEPGTSERGPEKRRRLLAYLRDHPEELRLHSRKLLARNLQQLPGE